MRNSNAIQSLKKYYNDRFAPIDPPELQKELEGTSDRAIVIILGSFIDDAMEFLISKKMIRVTDKEFKHAFRFDGPLGPFSSRIDLAYLFGWIDEDLKERLHALREMRNACAHSKRHISFETPELANVGMRFMRGAFLPVAGPSAHDLRKSIIAECFYQFNVLISSEKETKEKLKATIDQYLAEPKP